MCFDNSKYWLSACILVFLSVSSVKLHSSEVGLPQVKIEELDKRISKLESINENNNIIKDFVNPSPLFFYVASFCAWWAGSRRKNPLIWFLFGLILPPIACIYILVDVYTKYRQEIANV